LTLLTLVEAQAIVEYPGNIESAFAAYEAMMFPRSREKAFESAANLELAFEPNSPAGMLELFASYGVAAAGSP
jgi:hypothetical protein